MAISHFTSATIPSGKLFFHLVQMMEARSMTKLVGFYRMMSFYYIHLVPNVMTTTPSTTTPSFSDVVYPWPIRFPSTTCHSSIIKLLPFSDVLTEFLRIEVASANTGVSSHAEIVTGSCSFTNDGSFLRDAAGHDIGRLLH